MILNCQEFMVNIVLFLGFLLRFWTDKTHNHNSEASVFELAELTYNMGIYDHITNKTISTEEYSYQFR